MSHVLKFEGGYSDHPEDPGGATNYGITIGVLGEYRGRPVTKQDVRRLTKAEAGEIYHKLYWSAASCGKLPAGIDLAVFDCAVNQGVARAIRFLQKAARVNVDGIIGPISLAAVSSANRKKLLNEFIALRMRSYGLLRSLFRTFGLGWSRRLMATHSTALELLSEFSRRSVTNDQPTSRLSMDYIIQRLKEPSTYAGIAAFLASIGLLGINEQEWNQIFAAIAAVTAALAVFVKEKPAEPPKDVKPSVPANWPGN